MSCPGTPVSSPLYCLGNGGWAAPCGREGIPHPSHPGITSLVVLKELFHPSAEGSLPTHLRGLQPSPWLKYQGVWFCRASYCRNAYARRLAHSSSKIAVNFVARLVSGTTFEHPELCLVLSIAKSRQCISHTSQKHSVGSNQHAPSLKWTMTLFPIC